MENVNILLHILSSEAKYKEFGNIYLRRFVYLREMTENELEFFIKKSNQISRK